MTTATIEPGVIGTLPDPRIAVYHGSDPVAFVDACCVRPRDDERLRVWVRECRREYNAVEDRLNPLTDGFEFENLQHWMTHVENNSDVPLAVRCQLLRSLFPPPWLCWAAKCPGIGCEWNKGLSKNAQGRSHCTTCRGIGPIVTPPEFDERWRTVSVLDEARKIQGGEFGPCGEPSCKDGDRCSTKKTPPDYSRMPRLADALMDAGCDDMAILTHLHSGGPWVKEDWVLNLILGEIK